MRGAYLGRVKGLGKGRTKEVQLSMRPSALAAAEQVRGEGGWGKRRGGGGWGRVGEGEGEGRADSSGERGGGGGEGDGPGHNKAQVPDGVASNGVRGRGLRCLLAW